MRSRLLNDPAWFGATMGFGAMSAVAALNPGGLAALETPSRVLAIILLVCSVVGFVLLLARDIGVREIGRKTLADLRAPLSGPAYATIPGTINVIGIVLIALFPRYVDTAAGWIVILVIATIGTGFGLFLTVIFFVAAFEQIDFEAEDISGIWFIPETAVLLGSVLFAELAMEGPYGSARTFTIIALALMGAGALLFAFTAALFINRLVLHSQVRRTGSAAMWIMLSPMSVTALALHTVTHASVNLAGDWEADVQASSDLLASMLWGFCLWWIAAAAMITRHAGGNAYRFQPSSWAYVFPPAAMTLVTIVLGRYWDSAFMEVLSVLFSVILLLVTLGVGVGAVRAIRAEYRRSGPKTHAAG